jgi:hypothetical protein
MRSRGGDPRDQDNSQQAGTSSTNSPQAGHVARVGSGIRSPQEDGLPGVAERVSPFTAGFRAGSEAVEGPAKVSGNLPVLR